MFCAGKAGGSITFDRFIEAIDFVEAKKGRMDAQLFMTDYHGGFQRDSNVFSIE